MRKLQLTLSEVRAVKFQVTGSDPMSWLKPASRAARVRKVDQDDGRAPVKRF